MGKVEEEGGEKSAQTPAARRDAAEVRTRRHGAS